MDYSPRVPQAAPLAPGIELIFDLEGYLPGHSRERLVPNGRMTLVIELDSRTRHVFDNRTGEARQDCTNAWLSGVHTNYIVIGETHAENRLMAAQFAPGGSMPWTARPAEQFCDAVVPAVEIFGDSILDLRKSLLEADDSNGRLDRFQAWLKDRFQAEYVTPPELQQPLDQLVACPGATQLTDLVNGRGEVSYRHFVKLFRRHVGPPPKTMQRILRFAEVFARLQSNSELSWSELSLELGFSDQAHFIREFRSFSGYRPRQFEAQQHDRMNFFPDDPEVMP